MSKAMTELATNTPPNIMGDWDLTVGISGLSGVDNLHIPYQEHGGGQADRFFGSVRSSELNPSSYALVNGVVNSDGSLSFQVGMHGYIYTFNGQVDFPSLTGIWDSPGAPRLPGDDGTWHATATPPKEVPRNKGQHYGHGRP
jgi:hypothetical protein